MGSAEMSKRSHFWLRVAALVIIAASAWAPRGIATSRSASMQPADGESTLEPQAIHASVTAR